MKPRDTLAFILASVCIGCAPSPAERSQAPQKKASTPSQAQNAKVNLDEIFPAGRGRDLVLNNCTTCHTFVPIVILKMTREAWQRNSRDHRGRVVALTDADFKLLYEYLAANFGPDKPVPRLPNELMETWTSY